MFQVDVFWVVKPCNVVVGYQLSEVHAAAIFRVIDADDGSSMDL
jgi:hypothetical protein